MSKRFIITEDEKRSILRQYGLLRESDEPKPGDAQITKPEVVVKPQTGPKSGEAQITKPEVVVKPQTGPKSGEAQITKPEVVVHPKIDPKKTPNVTPTIKQVMDCKNGLYFKKGMKGDGVKELQKLLGMLDYKYLDLMRGGNQKLVQDGIFGSNTEAGIKKFQTDNQLKSDGLVGCNTMKKIYQVYLDKKPSGSTNTDLAVGDQGPAVDLGSDNSNLAFK